MTAGIWVAVIAAADLAATAWHLRAGLATPRWRAGAVLVAVVVLTGCALEGWALGAAFSAAQLLLLLRDWWNRKGRRAARELGARARAALDGMLERLRESGAPVPQGAPS